MKSETDSAHPVEAQPPQRALASPRVSRRRRTLFVAGAMLGAGAVAAVLLEIGLWVFAPIRFHEWMIWLPEGHIRGVPAPNQELLTHTGHLVHLNKYGFRGPDYTYTKSPGTLRIAALGGSSTFSFDASGIENTWPAVLEQRLHAALNMPVEVINLGLPGFDSFNSKINYLCFGRAFAPDAIVVYHTWNDMKMFRRIPQTPYSPTPPVTNKPFWQEIARKTQIGRHGREIFWYLKRRGLEQRLADDGYAPAVNDPIDAAAYAWERKNFEDFVSLAQRDGALPILVSQATTCVPAQLETEQGRHLLAGVPETLGIGLPLAFDVWTEVNKIIADVAEEGGAVFVDGYNLVPHDFDHLIDHVHLNDKGCHVLGEAIANVLLDDPRFAAVVDRVRAGP